MTEIRKRGRVVYMHTLDGRPAQYWPGEQVAFADDRRGVSRFADSLKQIRREERASERWRRSKGFDETSFEYGYVRVRLPNV